MQVKHIADQVIVVTGASSGIGLASAKMPAPKGARVILTARGEEALSMIVDEILAEGGDATYVVADVSKEQ